MSIGMNGRRAIDQPLPIYDGYGIGSTIQKDILEGPLLEGRRASFQAVLEESDSIIKALSGPQEDSSQRLSKVSSARINLMIAEREIISLGKKIEELKLPEVWKREEMLPIIQSRSPIETHQRSFSSERFHHIVLSKEGIKKEDPSFLRNKITEFFSDLRLQETKTSPQLDIETISSIEKNVKELIQTSGKVSLLGSFISVPRVRVMDPIILRKEAVSKSMIQNADKYYVITETVLGAYFYGYGVCLSELAGSSPEVDKQKTMSSMLTLSYDAQGMVPQTTGKFGEQNLWDIYSSWKTHLMADRESGYPIAIKVRELTDILRENKIPLSSPDEQVS